MDFLTQNKKSTPKLQQAKQLCQGPEVILKHMIFERELLLSLSPVEIGTLVGMLQLEEPEEEAEETLEESLK